MPVGLEYRVLGRRWAAWRRLAGGCSGYVMVPDADSAREDLTPVYAPLDQQRPAVRNAVKRAGLSR